MSIKYCVKNRSRGSFDNTNLANELDILSLNLLHHHDLHFVEEVQGEVTKSISVT